VIDDLTPRELRAMIPRQDDYIAACEILRARGWEFKVSQFTPPRVKNPYSYGWWIHPAHPTKCRPVGDPGNIFFKAWHTLTTYIQSDERSS
jgi:hypothetical protein